MKKLAIILASLAVLAAVALGGIAIALRVLFPPEKLKAMVITRVEKALSRRVEVEHVRLGLLSGFSLKELRVSGKPDFSAGEFISSRKFFVRFRLLPLLRKKFVVSEIGLYGLRLSVARKKDGTFNFSDLAGSTSRKKGAAAAPLALPLALEIGSAKISGAELKYHDLQSGLRAHVHDLNASLRNFRISGRVDFEGSMKASASGRAGKPYNAGLDVKGWFDLANLDLKSSRAGIEDCTIEIQGIRIKAKASMENAVSPSLKISGSVPAMTSQDLSLIAALPPGVRIPGSTLALGIQVSSSAIVVEPVKFKFASLEVNGKGSVEGLGGDVQTVSFKGISNRFSLKPFLDIIPQARGLQVRSNAAFAFEGGGPVTNPAVSKFEADLRVGRLTSKGLRSLGAVPPGISIPPLKATVSAGYRNRLVSLRALKFKLRDLSLRATGTLSMAEGKSPTFQMKIKSNDFSLRQMSSYAAMAREFGLDGRVRFSLNASGRLGSPKVGGWVTLQGVGAQYRKQDLSQITGVVRFTEDSLSIPRMTGRVNGGDLRLKLSARNFKSPDIRLRGSLSVLDAGALMALMPSTPTAKASARPPGEKKPYKGPALRTSGDFTAGRIIHPNFIGNGMSLSWNLSGITPDLKRINGKASFRMGEGKATEILNLIKEKKMMKAMLYPFLALEKARKKNIPGVRIPNLNEVSYQKVEGDYSFKKGVMSMQPFLVDGPLVYLRTEGTVDLPREKVDLHVATRLGTGSEESLAQGPAAVSVAFFVKGPFENPSIEPDLSKVLEKAKSKAGKEMKRFFDKKGKDVLKGLFK